MAMVTIGTRWGYFDGAITEWAEYSKLGLVIDVTQLLTSSPDSSKDLPLNGGAHLPAKRKWGIRCNVDLKKVETID